MLPSVFPSWIHHRTEPSKLVTDPEEYERLWEEGWRDNFHGIQEEADLGLNMVFSGETGEEEPQATPKPKGWPKGKKRKP